ncbi:MAG: hypothetical protein AUH85_11025 [Chloroflexi bacterium 13_1_40CM_4_68_4]|nr:MAG: hypothetical protein AUH85_11025 [Chloroflexi bacterium 13_1_40CM_4_68_4]
MAYDDRELRRRLHQAAEVIVVPDRPLRRRSRAFPILAGAAATALVLVVAVAVGQYLGGRRDQPGAVATSPTPTASLSPSATPSATSTASPTATATSSAKSPSISLPTMAQISAPSGDVVWALVAQGYLFRSMDRGASWELRPLPAPVVNAEIAFVNEREGWISAVGSPATQCQSQSIALWHTADAGANWDRLTPTGIADAQCKGQLSFVDANHGFVVAAAPQQKPVIYRTADGGRTWSASRPLADPPGVTTTPGGPNLQPGRVRGFGSVLLVPVAGPGAGASAAQYVYRSTDAGASWSYAATAANADGFLALVTDTRWLLIVLPGPSQETTDGGKTWHAYQSDYSQAAPIPPDVVFADASVGYATVRGSIQRTLDGGAHWTSIKTPGTG